MAVQIVTDSTCDLPREIVEEYGITVVPLTVFFGEEALLDGVEIGADAFYERLGTSHDLPRTSQPSAERFRQVYEGLAGETSEIVSIHLSSKLSGTLNSASVARDQVAHGGLHIELIDSYTVSLGLGLVVLEAAAAARTGASLENVVAAARRAMDRVMVYVAVDTLDYLRRGGRIGRASSFLGSVLSIKPIVGIEDGEVVPIERVRTRRRAEERIFELATADGRAKALFATCTGDRDATQELAARLRAVLPHTDVRPAMLGPTVGVYLGANALGVAILHGD
ncbi:MAG: DegV family protein [Dehalococcoidia bacterium]|nr:MAG: DegV family protein [bacterium]MCK6563510.1 DegV family protein [Dehalococcoidia bacterium]MCL4230182.1 DegV family protein [Dehalococcoidia bacterium]